MKTVKLALVLIILMTIIFTTGCPNTNTEPEPDPDSVVTKPNAPTDFIATVESDSAITLTWVDTSDNETGFILERSKDDFATVEVTVLLDANITIFPVTGLDANNPYFFRVKAVNSAGSLNNIKVSATTYDLFIVRPNAPSNVVAGTSVYNAIDVSWIDNSSDETGFYIQWADDPYFANYNDENIEPNETTYKITGLSANTTYYVQIQAEGNEANSIWVESTPVTTPEISEGVYKINNDASSTKSSIVTLNSNFVNMVEMHFVNYGGQWSSWETYSKTKTWVLQSGDGFKEVYAEFKDTLGTITQLSDSIILDTVPPDVTLFVINSDDESTNNNFVNLSSVVSGANVMRIKNDDVIDWSDWFSYTTSKGWLMTLTNGTKKVNVEFKDAAGNKLQTSDTIILDSTPPTINSFSIDSDGEYSSTAFTTDVTLHLGVDGNPTMMHFQNTSIFGSWSPWEPYSSSKSWTITPGENENHYVFVEVKDAMGNVSSPSNDYIYLDEYTTLEIYTWRINVYTDGDVVGSGEWHWHGYYVINDGDNQDICSGSKGNVDDGEIITIEDMSTMSFSNVDLVNLNFYYHATEDDSPFSDEDVGIASINYWYSTTYYKGFLETFYGGSGGDFPPSGEIAGFIRKIN